MSKIENVIKSFMKENSDNKLFIAVAEDILNSGYDEEDIKGYIEDIVRHGCISGCVSSMIYYSDTEKFFDEYSSEIFDLLNCLTEEIGDFPWRKDLDINKNNLSWFAYEEVSYRLNEYINNNNELEI